MCKQHHNADLQRFFYRVFIFIFGSILIQIGLIFMLILSWPTQESRIITCDVGQGDAILIIDRFTHMLVDAGVDNNQALECATNHLPWFHPRIDLFVATHPDFDHIGGAGSILDRFSVLHIWSSADAKESNGFRAFREAVLRKQKQGTHITFPVKGQEGMLGPEIMYKILYPLEESKLPFVFKSDMTETTLSDAIKEHESSIKNYNDRSIVVFLMINGVSVLLTGDIEEGAEKALLAKDLLSQARVLKVAHHGSKSSSIPSFVAKVAPEVSLISVGENNRYNHPSAEVVTRLKEARSQVFRTDVHGEIIMKIKNGSYSIETKK